MSLTYYLRKFGKGLSEQERLKIIDDAATFRNEGVEAKEANKLAIKAALEDTEAEIEDVLNQLKKQGAKI